MEIMGLEPGFRPIKKSRAHLLKYLPASQDELPTRSMQVTCHYKTWICSPIYNVLKQCQF